MFASLDEAFAAYEERFGGDGETLSLHTKIKVRMPVGKFPVGSLPASRSTDGTPQSIVLREYGTNGSTEVLVETSLGRLLLEHARSPTTSRSSTASMKKRDITEVVGELVVELRQGRRREQPRPA